jgi:diacylglycerol kinase (ATP)
VFDQVFINVAGVGYDAEVTANVDKMGMLINGQVTYIAALLKTLVNYRCANVTVTIDNATFDTRILLLAVGNGKYYGGGMKIVPDAVPDDGVFDIVMAVDFSVLETLLTLPKVYSGKHVDHPKARLFKGRSVTVVSRENPLSVQADGEAVGTTPATFRILADAIRVVRPFPTS